MMLFSMQQENMPSAAAVYDIGVCRLTTIGRHNPGVAALSASLRYYRVDHDCLNVQIGGDDDA